MCYCEKYNNLLQYLKNDFGPISFDLELFTLSFIESQQSVIANNSSFYDPSSINNIKLLCHVYFCYNLEGFVLNAKIWHSKKKYISAFDDFV